MQGYKENYKTWCNDPAFDEETKKELLALTDEKEIEDRFYKDLEFGTAGLRGIMGAGMNRINRFTVGRATLGLANYLLKHFPDAKERGVAIGFDTRNNSTALAKNAADVFTALGIKTYLFDQPVPTPTLSFAVRYLGCVSGIVLTASHNPPKYNGYKAYDEYGCQLGIEASKEVTREVEAIENFSLIPTKGNSKYLFSIGTELIDTFTSTVLRQSTFRDAEAKKNLKIVYTPIHGTGNIPVRQILKKDGFSDLTIVKEQELPDGNFPTVKSPNPEERGALQMGLDLAEKIGADLVIGTDPDADRIGCAVRDSEKMALLSGNQVGALLVDFILKTKNPIEKNPVMIKTVVTSDFGKAIAEKRGCSMMEVLTGFKFIGEKVTQFEKEKAKGDPDAHHFLLGFEESYGYLAGSHARDKDAVVAAMLICEMASFHKKNGKTLIGALNDLYEEFGTYLDTQTSFTLEGKEGLEKIAQMMINLRKDHSFMPGVIKKLDFEEGIGSLPKANVLKFLLEGGSWIVVRPSGTEPKIKIYYSIRAKDQKSAQIALEHWKEIMQKNLGL